MSVRDFRIARPFPRALKGLLVLAVLLIIAPIFFSEQRAFRYDNLNVRAAAPEWFSADSPNGSYSFVGVTAPTAVPPTAGPADSDGDGLLDPIDVCPGVAGVAANSGCPADQDGDGVPDASDACPTAAGDPALGGCAPTAIPVLPALPTTGACMIGTRTGQNVNVREAPTTSSAVVATLFYYTTTPVIGRTVNDLGEEWFQIDTGWVAGNVTRRGGDCDVLLATATPEVLPTGETSPTTTAPTGELTIALTSGVVPGSRGLIQLADPAGGPPQILLAQDGITLPLPPLGTGEISFPALQPAGENIAFLAANATGQRELLLAGLSQNGEPIVLIPSSSGLTAEPYPLAWSPDGAILLVTLTDTATGTTGIYRLDIANGVATGAPQLLVAGAHSPVFSQQANYVVYVKGSAPNRVVEVMSLADNSVFPITGQAPFADCSMPVFGLDSTDLLFVCDTAGQSLLARYSPGSITPVFAPVSTFVNLTVTGSRYLLLNDGTTIYSGPLFALVFTPLVQGGGQPIEWFQWLHGEGLAAG